MSTSGYGKDVLPGESAIMDVVRANVADHIRDAAGIEKAAFFQSHDRWIRLFNVDYTFEGRKVTHGAVTIQGSVEKDRFTIFVEAPGEYPRVPHTKKRLKASDLEDVFITLADI